MKKKKQKNPDIKQEALDISRRGGAGGSGFKNQITSNDDGGRKKKGPPNFTANAIAELTR